MAVDQWRRDGEIELVVVAAGGTRGVRLKVGGDGELGAPGAAEDGLGVTFGGGPGFEGMVGDSV